MANTTNGMMSQTTARKRPRMLIITMNPPKISMPALLPVIPHASARNVKNF
jgi:hypothetical protein